MQALASAFFRLHGVELNFKYAINFKKYFIFKRKNMSALAKQLKDEITRVANRRVRESVSALKKNMVQQKVDNGALKKRLSALETALKQLSKSTDGLTSKKTKPMSQKPRFRAAGFATLRKKLGINAAQTASLLGVSDQSVYKWEQGRARPRAAQLEAIVQLRKMGKRAVHKRLAELAQAQ